MNRNLSGLTSLTNWLTGNVRLVFMLICCPLLSSVLHRSLRLGTRKGSPPVRWNNTDLSRFSTILICQDSQQTNSQPVRTPLSLYQRSADNNNSSDYTFLLISNQLSYQSLASVLFQSVIYYVVDSYFIYKLLGTYVLKELFFYICPYEIQLHFNICPRHPHLKNYGTNDLCR